MSCHLHEISRQISRALKPFKNKHLAHSRFSIMFRIVVTFASFTVVSANCAENPSLPECAARGQDLLQKHASVGAGGAGLQLQAIPLMLGSTVSPSCPNVFFWRENIEI